MSAEPRVLLEFEARNSRWRIAAGDGQRGLQVLISGAWLTAGSVAEGRSEAVALAVYDAMRAREVRK